MLIVHLADGRRLGWAGAASLRAAIHAARDAADAAQQPLRQLLLALGAADSTAILRDAGLNPIAASAGLAHSPRSAAIALRRTLESLLRDHLRPDEHALIQPWEIDAAPLEHAALWRLAPLAKPIHLSPRHPVIDPTALDHALAHRHATRRALGIERDFVVLHLGRAAAPAPAQTASYFAGILNFAAVPSVALFPQRFTASDERGKRFAEHHRDAWKLLHARGDVLRLVAAADAVAVLRSPAPHAHRTLGIELAFAAAARKPVVAERVRDATADPLESETLAAAAHFVDPADRMNVAAALINLRDAVRDQSPDLRRRLDDAAHAARSFHADHAADRLLTAWRRTIHATGAPFRRVAHAG